jgi:hypothetical protein
MKFSLLSFIIWMEVLHLDEHLFRSFIHMDENVALGWTSLGFICKTGILNMLPTII